ncbi:MAG: 7TM diverse intracellular signaling domain-containing protein [Arcobacteraceae bacterium]
MLKHFFSLLLLALFLNAQSLSLILNSEQNAYENFTLEYFKDASNAMGIEEIALMQKEFSPSSSAFSLGYSPETLWLKLELKNIAQTEEFILSINEHFYEKANFYYFDKTWQKIGNGVFTPINKRQIQSSKLAYPLFLAQNSSKTVFLELKGVYPYIGNISIYTKPYFYSHQLFSINTFFIFLFGILTIIFIFNLFLWINLREVIYLYYAGYSFFSFIYFLNISGLLAYINLQYYMFELHFAAGLSVIFLSLFSIEYFNAKKHFKKATYILKILMLIIAIFGILMLFSYTPWNKIINNAITLTLLSLIVTSIVIYKKGQHFLKYYIFAITVYFLSIIIYILLLSGVVEYNSFTRYGYLFSLCLEIIIFSLMLANRYNIIKNSQISTQNELIDLQNNQNKKLENEVKKQTQSLQGANKKLSKLLKERELLVKEVFHRVKNNFHMIIAFLWFESKKESDKNRFSELINRIKSMSLIHEYLCNSKDLVHINVQEYLDELIQTIIRTYVNSNVTLNKKVDNIRIDFDHIMSLGVIINEIISNSIKHHPKKIPIVLDIACFKKNHLVVLHIKDNGMGFDLNEHPTGFGLELIKDFSSKLPEGSFCFYQDSGTVFELTFKDERNDKI